MSGFTFAIKILEGLYARGGIKKAALTTCQDDGYGKGPTPTSSLDGRNLFGPYLFNSIQLVRLKRHGQSCSGLDKQTQAVKKKVVAGSVHRGVSSVHVAGALLFTYCKYIAVGVSD
jgi:hypothetical protein